MPRYHIKNEPIPSTLRQWVNQVEMQIQEIHEVFYGPVGHKSACKEVFVRLERLIPWNELTLLPIAIPEWPQSDDVPHKPRCLDYLEKLLSAVRAKLPGRPSLKERDDEWLRRNEKDHESSGEIAKGETVGASAVRKGIIRARERAVKKP